MLIYSIFKHLFLIGLRQFFRRVHVRYPERILESGPVLVVSNHPNNLLDPVIVASLYKRKFSFLAKSPLFKFPIKYLMNALQMIPVYRPRDGSDPNKNTEMFKAVAEKISSGQAVMIFPEGTSEWQRNLLEIKTGPARIALQAADVSGDRSLIKIQPIGLTYHDYRLYRGSVTASVGEPISMENFKVTGDDSKEVVRRLTDEIDRQLRALTVNIDDPVRAAFIEKISKVYGFSQRDDYERMSLVAKGVEHLLPKYPERRIEIEKRIDEYFAKADELGIIPGLERVRFSRAWLVLLLSPVILLGWILNWPPYRLTARAMENSSFEHTFRATIAILMGIVSFLAWYCLCGIVGMKILPLPPIAGFITGFAVPALTGALANSSYMKLKVLFWSAGFWNSQRLKDLRELGNSLYSELEELKTEVGL